MNLRRCPTCAQRYLDGPRHCPTDGAPLEGHPPDPSEAWQHCTVCPRVYGPDARHCLEEGARLTRPGPPRDPLLGRLLDARYRLDARIGEGGMGAVYRARQLTLDRDVAVKVLRPGPDAGESRARRFRTEALIISRLGHPNTLKLIDHGCTDDGLSYIVTELLQGESLAMRLARGPLPVPQALYLAAQVCGPLSEAHTAGIVHRDLKPANLFLQTVAGGTVVKVLDFGIAKLLDDNEPSSAALTTTGGLSGSPAYMSPEQCRGDLLDGRSDLYSLGVVLFECLAGVRPFQAGSAMALMMLHLREPPAPWPARRAGRAVPAPVVALVMRLLEKAPQARLADAGALRTLVESLGRVHGLAPFDPAPPVDPTVSVPARSNGPSVRDAGSDDTPARM